MQGGGKNGRRGIAAFRLDQNCARLCPNCGQLFGNDKAKIAVGDDQRRAKICTTHAQQSHLKQALIAHKGHELLWVAFARQGPKTRARTATKKNRCKNRHVTETYP